jgi:hypothetical protein
MDRAVTGTVPHVRDASGCEVGVQSADRDVDAKTRTALILLSIVVVFFIGVFLRHWPW